jgi:hypothetical protein
MNKNILVGFVVMLMMLSQPFFPMAAGSAPEGGLGDSTSGTSSRATLETWTESD